MSNAAGTSMSLCRLACAGGLLLAGIAPVSAADEAATDYWVRVMPSLWLPKLSGNFAYQDTGGSATTLNTDDLGLGSRQNSFSIEAGAQIPFLFGFHVGLTNFSNSATSTLSQNVIFGNQTFLASNQVKTDVKLRDAYGEICIRPLNLDLVGFSVGVAVHGVRGDLKMDDLTTGTSDEVAKTIPIPVVAVRAHVSPISALTAEVRIHYFEVSARGDHLRYADAAFQVSYRPIEYVGILAGYRYTLLDLHLKDPSGSNSTADTNLTLKGPYLGLIAKF